VHTPGAAPAVEAAPLPIGAETKARGAGIFLNEMSAPSTHPPLPVATPNQTLFQQRMTAPVKDAAPELDTTNRSGQDLVRISRRVRQLCEADIRLERRR